MARKFSLKDNPIFQRLEIPKPRQILEEVEDTSPNSLEGQILTLKIRPSEFDPQIPDTPPLDNPKEGINVVPDPEQEAPRGGQEGASPNTGVSIDRQQTDDEVTTTVTISTPVTAEDAPRDQAIGNETVSSPTENGGSEFDPQILTLKNYPSIDSEEVQEEVLPKVEEDRLAPQEGDASLPTTKPLDQLKVKTTLPLEDHLEKSLFFGFYNEVSDTLLPTLNAAEQVLYSRLFRLSYGFNRNYCTVSQQLLRERTGLSKNTVRIGLQSLVTQEWILVLDAGNHVSTTYRVVLPHEKSQENNPEGQNLTLKNRPSKSEGQNLRVKIRGSKSDPPEGQNLTLTNLTPKIKKDKFFKKNKDLHEGGSNSEGQNLTPLLLTLQSLTLSEREALLNTSKEDFRTLAEPLVDHFYSLLSQKPSSVKRERNIAECVALLRDGFSVDQVRYAVEWTITELPGTGSFSRVVHVIDQATKAHSDGEKIVEKQRERESDIDRQRQKEQQHEEEEKRIDAIRKSLTPQDLEQLVVEATELVTAEHGDLRFGRETLIQIKVRELIRQRHLAS